MTAAPVVLVRIGSATRTSEAMESPRSILDRRYGYAKYRVDLLRCEVLLAIEKGRSVVKMVSNDVWGTVTRSGDREWYL